VNHVASCGTCRRNIYTKGEQCPELSSLFGGARSGKKPWYTLDEILDRFGLTRHDLARDDSGSEQES
jgi:hypothetical protein